MFIGIYMAAQAHMCHTEASVHPREQQGCHRLCCHYRNNFRITVMDSTLLLVVLMVLPGCHPHTTGDSGKNEVKSDASDSNSSIKRLFFDNCCCFSECSQTYGGFCTEDTTQCDIVMTFNSLITLGKCQCCINCPTQGCDLDGACKTKCADDEMEVASTDCSNCKCCKRCPNANMNRRCVGSPDFCKPTEYTDGKCGTSQCTKCRPCLSGSDCEGAGGRCFSVANGCPCKYMEMPQFTCDGGSNCICCVPE